MKVDAATPIASAGDETNMGGGGRGREDYVQCAAARLQEQNGSLLHMDSFGAIQRVERNVLACPTLKEPASL